MKATLGDMLFFSFFGGFTMLVTLAVGFGPMVWRARKPPTALGREELRDVAAQLRVLSQRVEALVPPEERPQADDRVRASA